MKLYIFPNLDKKNCRNYTKSACEILVKNNVSVFMSDAYMRDFSDVDGIEYIDNDCIIEDCDFILAVGGDGTILRCSDLARKHKKPLLGLNCGRLGFMATLEHDEIELLNDFCNGKYVLDKRMMVDAVVYYENGSTKRVTALNDIVLTKNHGCKIADFIVSKNDKIISSLRADGLVFSTPTGSTAYSLSAGGPIIEPDMECIEFTQICPHSLFARSMLFSGNSVIEVRFKTNNKARVLFSVDGVEIDKISSNDYVKILKSDDYVEIVDIKGGSFFKSVNRKLMQPFKEVLEEV